MACHGNPNIVTRRVTDDLSGFNGETVIPRYMKFFLNQKIAESRRFVNRVRDEAETVRGCISQLTAVVAELQAMENQDEVHDSLLAAKDAKRGEESKLLALNDVIAEALGDIETLETNVEILDGENNEVDVLFWKCMDVGLISNTPLSGSNKIKLLQAATRLLLAARQPLCAGGFRSLVADVGACFATYFELYGYASWLVLAQGVRFFVILPTGKGYRGNGKVGNELGDVLGVVVLAINRGRGGYKVGGKWGSTVMVRRVAMLDPSQGFIDLWGKFGDLELPSVVRSLKVVLDAMTIHFEILARWLENAQTVPYGIYSSDGERAIPHGFLRLLEEIL
ncbi:hypothetical protein Tco_1234914 [Tanacetum coccineum]